MLFLTCFTNILAMLCFICLTLVFFLPVAIHGGIRMARPPRDVLGSLDWYLHILGRRSLSLSNLCRLQLVYHNILSSSISILSRVL